MIDLMAFIIIALATYRVATDGAWESGPFHIFEKWRGWLETKLSPYHWITEGFSCPICLSFWISPAIYGLWLVAPIIVMILAAAGVAAVLARYQPNDGG